MITGGEKMYCDDSIEETKTGPYTYTVTWNRRVDGRGHVFGEFLAQRVEYWTFDGSAWSMTSKSDSYINYTTSTLQYCF